MNHEEQSLLRTIVDSPGDRVPRMVYADWLEEQGRAEEAESQRNFPLRYVRSLRVSDKTLLMSRHVDEAMRARDICRRDALQELAPRLGPGRYILEVREEATPDPYNRCTEMRCEVEIREIPPREAWQQH